MLGQVNALTQQIQRATDEAQALSQEEQALTKEWQEVCADLNISLNIQEDIAPWMNEQEQYERQLYQLSQRLTLQNQQRTASAGASVSAAAVSNASGTGKRPARAVAACS